MVRQKFADSFAQMPRSALVREVLPVPGMTMLLASFYLAATFVRDVPLTLAQNTCLTALAICLVLLGVAGGLAAMLWTRNALMRVGLALSCVVNALSWSALAGADLVNFVNGWGHTARSGAYQAAVLENRITHGKGGRLTLKLALKEAPAGLPSTITLQSSNFFTEQQYARLSGAPVEVYLATGRLGLLYITAFRAND